MWKKLILGVVIILLVSFVLFVYNEFNGNPMSKYRAQKALEQYLEDTYPEKIVRINNGVYNFKFNTYDFTGIVVENRLNDGSDEKEREEPEIHEYQFSVQGFLFPEVQSDGIRISQLNYELMERLGEEAGKEIYHLLQPFVENIHTVQVRVEVLKGQMDENNSWDKDLKLDGPMDIFIVLDASNATVHDVYEATKIIQNILNDNGYDYKRVNINANVIQAPTDFGNDRKSESGYVKYAVAFQKGQEIKGKDIKEF